MPRMRGDHREPDSMFSYVSAEQRIPKDHPLRAIRTLVDAVLADMSREFEGLYALTGRPSIPPERLLRAQLLQIFYSIRSELLLMGFLKNRSIFSSVVIVQSLSLRDVEANKTDYTSPPAGSKTSRHRSPTLRALVQQS